MAIDRDGQKRDYTASSTETLLDLHSLGILTESAYDLLRDILLFS